MTSDEWSIGGDHPRRTSLGVGTQVGIYRIDARLGEGGMGTVYRATDTKLNRPVAIKVLSDELADLAARRRFQREAQLASSLNHPHIVTVYDVGEFEGRQYIATEFVDGGTLKDWAKTEKRTWGQIVELLTGVADGVATAHSAGITHRDIKPANILVARNGYAKLADFGLAKLTEDAQTDVTRTLTEGRTGPGIVVGTVAYMSPEQASGGPLDARSDVFAFGVVLYELLAGRRPFSGATELEVLKTIIHGAPEPLGEEVPVALRLAVDKALAKDPAERYQSMREMVVDLRRLSRQRAETPAQVKTRPARGFKWAWATLLPVLLVAAYFAWRVWRSPQPAEPLRAVALTAFPGVESYPSFAPDGDRVAFMWTGPKQDNADIYVQQIGSGSPLRLTTDPRNDFSPAWSPDGRWIAFLRNDSSLSGALEPGTLTGKAELRLIPPLGGPERKVAEIQIGISYNRMTNLAWCPDSDCLVVTESLPTEPNSLFVISLETGEKRRLTNPLRSGGGDGDPAVSPDGRSLVFRRETSVAASEIYWLPLGKNTEAGSEPRALTSMGLNAAYPAWMPDGKEILFSSSGSLWRLPVSGENPGENRPARLPFVGEDGLMPVVSRPQPAKAPRLVYVRSFRDSNIWSIKTSASGVPSTSPPSVSISSTRTDFTPAFAPDGRRVAFSSDRSGVNEIWVADSDGSNASQLTSLGVATGTSVPSWSPDGQQIAFHSDIEKQYEIYVIPASGGKPRRLTSHPLNDGFPSFSRDGRWVYFTSNRTGRSEIWKVPASGGDAVQVTHDGGSGPVESPDGAYVYYVRGPIAAGSLWRMPASRGEPIQVLDGLYNVGFAVVEKGIYYVDRPASETRLQFLELATGRSTTVTNSLGDTLPSLLAVAPDGRTILYARLDSSIDDLMLVENFR